MKSLDVILLVNSFLASGTFIFFGNFGQAITEGREPFNIAHLLAIVIFEVLLIVLFVLKKDKIFKYLFRILTVPLIPFGVLFFIGVIVFILSALRF